jgi:hypothetical protein
MALMIPPITADYRYDGEKEIAYRLQNDPHTSDWTVLHSLDIANHKSQITGECDFIVIVPGSGVLCLEVKGCRSLKVENGLWYYGKKKEKDARGPFKQVSDNMHSIRGYLEKNNKELSSIVFWSAVIFPYLSFSIVSPEWHRWQVIDVRSLLSRPISQLCRNILERGRALLKTRPASGWFKPEVYEPGQQQQIAITNLLRPEFEYFESPVSRRNSLNKELKIYTDEQYTALDAMRSNKRAIFSGPAGTGKTLLTLESARRNAISGRRVLLLCFNKFISKWLDEQFGNESFDNVKITRLHLLMLEVTGIKPSPNPDQTFWTETLPEKAIDTLLSDSEGEFQRYDILLIDEAQDILRQSYLDFLDLILIGGLRSGSWQMFGDFIYQKIYSAVSMNIDEFILSGNINASIYNLNINCRNTPRVAAYAPLLGGLEPDYKRILRPDDSIKPEMIFYESEKEQIAILANLLHRFREVEKYKGDEIVILSPLADKCCATKLDLPWRDRIKPYRVELAGGHVRYCSIYAFKGLESPVVIVTDLNQVKNSESRNLLYIAVTRTLARLVLCINRTARSDLRKFLGA